MLNSQLPLLPLLLDDVPASLGEILAQEGVPFLPRSERPMAGQFVLFDSQAGPCRPLGYGQQAIDVDALRDTWDGDPFRAYADERSAPHRWQIAGLSVTEEVARVDRRKLRQRVLGRLRELLEAAGGVWLCVAAFPFPYRSALNVRIDYDEFDASDFDATHAAIAGHEEATSHFINAAEYLPHSDVLRRFDGLDVGSHGFRHHTYRTEAENLRNIRRGIEALEAFHLKPSGFVAPHGRFHRGLLDVMEQLQIDHSSEFGFAYDDLPLFPCGGKVLQIPVHPVCLAIFLDAVRGEGPRRLSATQQAVRAAVDHFRQTARAKYHAGEPVFFYGHPTGRLGRYPQVLQAIFDTADAFGAIWRTTLTQFADWWRARATVRLSLIRRGEGFVVVVPRRPRGYRVAVEYWRGRHVARMPVDRRALRFSPTALAYEQRGSSPPVRPVRVDGSEGLRGHLRRMIDWERVTPLDEIPKQSWRHWAKRALRRWES